MESPLSSPDSQPESRNEPATNNEPQIITEPAEESGPQNLDTRAEDNVPQDPNEPVKFSKPQIVIEPPEASRLQNLNEQAKDSEDQPTQDDRLQDFNGPHENSQRRGSAVQDLENEAEAPGDVPEEISLGKEESPLHSTSEGQEVTTTDDVTARKPSLDDNAPGLPEPATDHPPPALDAPVKTVAEEPEQPPQYKKKSFSRIFTTGLQEKTIKKGKAEEVPGSGERKRCFHPCDHSSLAAKPMFSWSPSQLAKATLRPKSKPQTVDKTTQIYPGRVPRLPKLPPKRVLPPPKPKPPSADKVTEISPSFEKLLKRPPPVMTKKKKKEEINPATVTPVCQHGTGFPSKSQSFSGHRGRSPRTGATSPSLRVKSSKSGPPHVKSLKSVPLRTKSSKSGPLRVKSAKSMPLRVKVSSSSPSKHRLNLSLFPRKKRKTICNLYITFCDYWDEPHPCCLQETMWEEPLSSCSGLYRACSVFSVIRYGRIHVTNLLLALHMLGVLVTSEEMYQILHHINVDEHESLNFWEFLEAVNTTSPFAETVAFQNTLQAFRKMKKGMVSVKELEPVLLYLGISLSREMVQQTLGRTKVNKNGKFDMSDFLLAAKDLQRILEEEKEAFLNECTIFKRRPFQDVADLVDAERRRRRKYCDCFNEETPMSTCLLPILMSQESAEDAAPGKQPSRTSNMDLRRSSTASCGSVPKEEAKDGDAMEVTTSQMGLSSDLKSSSHESLVNHAKEENNEAVELRKSQVELPSQNTEGPVPA